MAASLKNGTFPEAGALIVRQCHPCFFSDVGGSVTLLFPVFPLSSIWELSERLIAMR